MENQPNPWKPIKTDIEPWKTNLEPSKLTWSCTRWLWVNQVVTRDSQEEVMILRDKHTHKDTLHHNIYIIIRWSRSSSNMLLPPTGPRIVHLSVWRHRQRRRSQGNNQLLSNAQSDERNDKEADISMIPKGEDHKERSRLHLATSWRDLDLSSARCVTKINKLVEYFLSFILLLIVLSPPIS